MALRFVTLNDEGWEQLKELLNERQYNPFITDVLIRRLQELSAASFLLEEDYIDRDFSEAYTAYYARTFRRHEKRCRRILFFGGDISFLNTEHDIRAAADALQDVPFLGQVILRPISQAPIGQALLAPPPSPEGYEGQALVRGEYSAHILGAELRVCGVPMTQQDSRVGACAQASIWVASRHFHARHSGPWLSTVSITNAAIANSESAINLVLPAGSEFLTVNNMVAALRAAGREPLVYAPLQQGGWGHVRPHDIINRYVDSGIPVIMGLVRPNQVIGHAIVLTGQVLKSKVDEPLPPRPTTAEFCEAFYANDDQIGPNIMVGVRPGSPLSEADYSIANANYLIIPLPGKVFHPAEKAETIAWDLLRRYSSQWDDYKTRYAGKLGTSEALGDELVAAVAAEKVVARTYLTYGWKYKHRAIRNNLPNSVKQAIRGLGAPRFVFVTEFSTVDHLSRPTLKRRILSHCVVDATAKNEDLESALIFHAPGFLLWHEQAESFVRCVAPVPDSEPYFPKIRGDTDFSSFFQDAQAERLASPEQPAE